MFFTSLLKEVNKFKKDRRAPVLFLFYIIIRIVGFEELDISLVLVVFQSGLPVWFPKYILIFC